MVRIYWKHMTNVNVDNELLKKVKESIKDRIEFAHVKQFIDIAIKEKLTKLEKEKDKCN